MDLSDLMLLYRLEEPTKIVPPNRCRKQKEMIVGLAQWVQGPKPLARLEAPILAPQSQLLVLRLLVGHSPKFPLAKQTTRIVRKYMFNDGFLFVSWIYWNWCCSDSLAAQFREVKALNPCHLSFLRVHLIREYKFYDHIWLCRGFISQLMLLYLLEEVPKDQQAKVPIRRLCQVRLLRRCHRHGEYDHICLCHGFVSQTDVALPAWRGPSGEGHASGLHKSGSSPPPAVPPWV